MEFLEDLFMLLGRVFISGVFLWGAYEKVKNWNATMTHLKSKSVPQVNIVAPVSIALKILGGLSVLLGWHAHIGALLLLIVAVPSAIWLHAFWKIHGPEHNIEKAIFMKEVAVIGGLLLLLAMGGGHWGFGTGG